MYCEIINTSIINKEIFRLDVIWQGAAQSKLAAPKAGQFFMIKPKRSTVFLGRPICVALWQPAVKDKDYIRRKARGKKTPYQRYLTGKYLESDTVVFLIAKIGKGTAELASMRTGEEVELIGPLGNAWTDFLPLEKNGAKPIALIGGGLGIAPLNALLCEEPGHVFDLYAGFKTGFTSMEEKAAFLGPAINAQNIILASEDGKTGQKGLILDFLEPEKYAAVCACGTKLFLKAVAEKCIAKGVPCFISMESRMACGVGACLGCTIKTVNGNRRCCADGPIFKAEEVIFDDK
jgi:NAD(P)H-flavin reductase